MVAKTQILINRYKTAVLETEANRSILYYIKITKKPLKIVGGKGGWLAEGLSIAWEEASCTKKVGHAIRMYLDLKTKNFVNPEKTKSRNRPNHNFAASTTTMEQ